MAAITWADVTGVATEFGTSTPAWAQLVFLSIVNGSGVSAANFGGEDSELTRAARIFYAAHLETMRRRRGITGAIASQSEGGASQSYWMGLMNPRLLYLTGYGSMISQLIMGTPARAGIVVG